MTHIKGDKVFFGRRNGEKTLGEIVKVNRKTYKVKTLETRGAQKVRGAGVVWTVPKGLVTPAGDERPDRNTSTPTSDELATLLTLWRASTNDLGTLKLYNAKAEAPAGHEASLSAKGLWFSRSATQGNITDEGVDALVNAGLYTKPKRAELEILSEIDGVYSGLSPENLTCDGELSRTAVRRKGAQLRGKLKRLFKELGRTVDESECWRRLSAERDAARKASA